MIMRSVLAVILSVSMASAVLAAGSTSPSRPPPPTGYDLGVKAVKAGDYARALALLRKVVVANPRDANAWNYIGFSHRKLNRFDQALAAYNKALAIKPDHRGANEYLGELYLQIGDPAKAKERLKILDSACFFGCEEFDDLKAAIASYEARPK